jgi:hypothetical protein
MLLRQSVISPRNIGMASEWAGSQDREVAELARIVADIGRVHPGRKRRLPHIRTQKPELWERMLAAGVVQPDPQYSWDDEHDDDWLADEVVVHAVSQSPTEDDGDEIPF